MKTTAMNARTMRVMVALAARRVTRSEAVADAWIYASVMALAVAGMSGNLPLMALAIANAIAAKNHNDKF